MSQQRPLRVLSALVLLATATLARADTPATKPAYQRTQDVMYGRSYGTLLAMDVFTPAAQPNGRGVVLVVSGGWVSSKDSVSPRFEQWFVQPLVARGYTVFAVVHGSQPKYTINEIVPMIRRAVRFVKFHARDYAVDPDHLGICGGSAGGHLSLMIGSESEPGDPKAPDPIDRLDSSVAAVAAFFPPTDFLNYGKEGNVNLGTGTLQAFRAPFDFREMSKKTHALERVTEARSLEIGREISPVYHVSAHSAPTLLLHGDADQLVPIQQSELYVAKMKEAGVPVELVRRPGKGHGWGDIAPDLAKIGDWFDIHLVRGAGTAPTTAPTR